MLEQLLMSTEFDVVVPSQKYGAVNDQVIITSDLTLWMSNHTQMPDGWRAKVARLEPGPNGSIHAWARWFDHKTWGDSRLVFLPRTGLLVFDPNDPRWRCECMRRLKGDPFDPEQS